MVENIAVIGSNGAIGRAIVQHLASVHPKANIHTFARRAMAQDLPHTVTSHVLNTSNETEIAQAAQIASGSAPLDLVFVAVGMLHDGHIMPEKALRDLSAQKFQKLFEVNTILPALCAKHFLPRLHKDRRAAFAALSARVGSVSDNRLGGWYGYRASKAALNMVIKNAAIEMRRRNPQAIIVGLHPGTVASNLSAPFQSNVAKGKLFTPDDAAQKLIDVLDHLPASASGKCFAWDGNEIAP